MAEESGFPHSQQKGEEPRGHTLKRNTCSDILLPIKSHVLEFPELSKMVPPAEDQAFNT